MRFLLSQIDQVSAGEVVYPPGGRLGPRWQRDVELVLVHDGHARIAVDGEARAILRAGSVGLLLPGHREQFAFAGDVETRHSWVQVRVADPPVERLSALPAALPASTALTEVVREAVTVAPRRCRRPSRCSPPSPPPRSGATPARPSRTWAGRARPSSARAASSTNTSRTRA
jgi:hypothetical protein